MDTLSVVSHQDFQCRIAGVSTLQYGRVAFYLDTGNVFEWDLNSGKCIGNYPGGHVCKYHEDIYSFSRPYGGLKLIEYIREGQFIPSDNDGMTYVWSSQKVYKQPSRKEKNRNPILGIAVSVDYSLVATQHDCTDQTLGAVVECVRVWEAYFFETT